METMQIDGVALEVQRIDGAADGRLAPIVFLHEGLGSVAMWRDWPMSVCRASGRAGVVYSRRGYGAARQNRSPAATAGAARRRSDMRRVRRLSRRGSR